MKKILILLALFLSLLPAPAFAGFEEGKAAYDRKDWIAAITALRPLAEAGDDRAMVVLGNMYYFGFGVIKDAGEALALYRRAAVASNNPEAMLATAALYVSGGDGLDKNLNTALKWFRRAAALGDQTGAFFTATILLRGNKSASDDIPSDIPQAYHWFRLAAAGKQYPQMAGQAKLIADQLAAKKMTPEEVARADQAVAAWKPVSPADLGPPPEEPAADKLPGHKAPAPEEPAPKPAP